MIALVAVKSELSVPCRICFGSSRHLRLAARVDAGDAAPTSRAA
jgi:hypothetical protein